MTKEEVIKLIKKQKETIKQLEFEIYRKDELLREKQLIIDLYNKRNGKK